MLKRITSGEKIFQIANVLILILFSFIIIIPLWTVVMSSFVSQAEIMRRGVFILMPQEWNFDAYRLLLGPGSNVYRAYANTLFVVGMGTALSLAFTISLAYGLSKRHFKGRTLITGLIFFTMLFSGGMVPSYMVVKSLGLLNSLWALILPGLIGTWNMFIMRNFFYAIPDSLEEAAILDGANQMQVLVRIVLPLSLASIATIGLFYAVGYWNAWFGAVLYITDNSKLPMQNILRNIVSTMGSNFGDVDSVVYEMMRTPPPTQALKAATIVVGTLPILVVYPFVQKYFVKGIMIGSIKG